MDPFIIISLLIACILGIVSVWLLSGFFRKKIRSPLLRTTASFSIILVFMIVGSSLTSLQWFRDAFMPPTRLELLLRDAGNRLHADPGFNAEIKGKTLKDIEWFGGEKSEKGMKRLELDHLIRWNEIRLILSKESQYMCLKFWDGRADSYKINKALDQLSDQDLKEFIDIKVSALLLELSQTPFTPVPPDSFTIGIWQILKGLKPEDAGRLRNILKDPGNSSEKDACWAITVLLNDSSKLRAGYREDFLRALASGQLIDEGFILPD